MNSWYEYLINFTFWVPGSPFNSAAQGAPDAAKTGILLQPEYQLRNELVKPNELQDPYVVDGAWDEKADRAEKLENAFKSE